MKIAYRIIVVLILEKKKRREAYKNDEQNDDYYWYWTYNENKREREKKKPRERERWKQQQHKKKSIESKGKKDLWIQEIGLCCDEYRHTNHIRIDKLVVKWIELINIIIYIERILFNKEYSILLINYSQDKYICYNNWEIYHV